MLFCKRESQCYHATSLRNVLILQHPSYARSTSLSLRVISFVQSSCCLYFPICCLRHSPQDRSKATHSKCFPSRQAIILLPDPQHHHLPLCAQSTSQITITMTKNITEPSEAFKMPHQHLACSSTCKAKHLLLRDIRPAPNSQSQFLLRKADLCSIRCIYCDIWKLALLVSSRHSRSQNRSTPTSPCLSDFYASPPPVSDYEKALKSIESGHHLQRARLSSIISICTVEGAEESEGLRIAHDRCLGAVFELMRQERALQRQILLQRENSEREAVERDQEIREWRDRQRERDGGHGYRARQVEFNWSESRRGSEVSCAT